MKKQLELIPIYLNIIYLILLIIVILAAGKASLDFRMNYSGSNTLFIANIIYWIIVLASIILNVKKMKWLILAIVVSVVNYFLIDVAFNAFMPW